MLPAANLLLGAKGHRTVTRVVNSSRTDETAQPLGREGTPPGLKSVVKGDLTTLCKGCGRLFVLLPGVTSALRDGCSACMYVRI